MPETKILYYCELDGSAPVLDWITDVARKHRKAAEKFLARIESLADLGHELRRPVADILRDGIYELRIRVGNVNYRILYFFHGRNVAVLTHGLTKEKKVPDADIERAIRRKAAFESDPEKHTYREEEPDG
jgi:phage-related protein